MLTLLMGAAVFYFTSVLLFSMEHRGPYPRPHAEVALGTYDETSHERSFLLRPVDLFDYLRRPFGVYSISTDADGHALWVVRIHAIAVWQCPHCLGFWIAFVLASFFSFWYQDAQSFFIYWWAAAGINSILVRILG